MKHEPVAIRWNNRLYYKKGYFEYLCDNFIDEMKITEEVEDIFDVSESDGNTFYIPCWQIDFLNGDYIRIENMNNLLVIYSKEKIVIND